VALAAPGLSPGQKIALFLATASFIGQVSHPNAHELIHRRNRVLAGLGALVYVSIGFGHHFSAHRLVHHRFVATPEDPNTPRMGESYWRYLPRAWAGSFREGLRAEAGRRARGANRINPYWVWCGGAVLTARPGEIGEELPGHPARARAARRLPFDRLGAQRLVVDREELPRHA
jgi:alkane 1-monooxygenase